MADGNPFDAPLASEIQDHQQTQAATVQASSNGNPFDEPLMSEKADAQANSSTKPYDPQVFGKFTTAENYPTWLKTSPKSGPTLKPGEAEAWMSAHTPGGMKQMATDAAVPVVAGAATAGAVLTAPEIIGAAIEHLGSLDKIVQAAKGLGYGAFGLKEAHDLYKMVAGDSK